MATTVERGYGAPHKAERLRWERELQSAGAVACAKCGQLIRRGDPWDLGHTADRTGWTGPEHPYCNRADGAARANGAGMTVRDW